MGAAYIVYYMTSLFGCKDITFDKLAKEIGMFFSQKNNKLNSSAINSDKEKAAETLALFLNKEWDTPNG